VYDRTINILCGDSLWVCLHPEGAPRHPYSVIVGGREGCASARGGGSGGAGYDAGAGGFLGASVGEPAYACRSWIGIGETHIISLLGASAWDGRFVGPRSLGDRDVGFAAGLVEAAVLEHARNRDVRSPFLVGVLARVGGDHHVGTPTRRDLDRRLLENVGSILDGLGLAKRVGSGGLILAAVRRAVGLGFGSTPSGDDFLTGLVAASYVCPGPGDFTRDLVAAVDSAAGSTTLPSGFMLRAAIRGYFSEPLVNLLSALATTEADAAEARDWVDAVAGLGATSGEDMLAGVLFGLRTLGVCEECYEASAR
jgi:hypothetical protein